MSEKECEIGAIRGWNINDSKKHLGKAGINCLHNKSICMFV